MDNMIKNDKMKEKRNLYVNIRCAYEREIFILNVIISNYNYLSDKNARDLKIVAPSVLLHRKIMCIYI